MNCEIARHQELQKLQWEVQEVFIMAQQRKLSSDRVIDILKSMFDTRKEEELDKQFWEKYNSGVVHTANRDTEQGVALFV